MNNDPTTNPPDIEPTIEPAPKTPSETPVTNEAEGGTSTPSRTSQLKFAFLYLVVGGLIVSALISVVAILIGEFNAIVQKAILTTVSLVIHSVLVLLVVLADKKNQLGKALLPTVFVGILIADMVTSTLSIWGAFDGTTLAGRFFNLYALVMGTAFLVTASLHLRLGTQLMQSLAYVSIALVLILAVALVPWVLFAGGAWLTDLYYRIITATAILAVTSVVVTAIVNRISTAQHPELSATAPETERLSRRLRGIMIAVGVITALTWFVGFVGLSISAASANRPAQTTNYS